MTIGLGLRCVGRGFPCTVSLCAWVLGRDITEMSVVVS